MLQSKAHARVGVLCVVSFSVLIAGCFKSSNGGSPTAILGSEDGSVAYDATSDAPAADGGGGEANADAFVDGPVDASMHGIDAVADAPPDGAGETSTNDGGESEGGAVGPVAWWTGNGTPDDATGQYDGTIVGSVTYGPGNSGGEAFSFPGANAYVSVPSGILPAGTGDFTVTAWAQLSSLASGLEWTIFYAGAPLFELYLQSGREPAFVIHGTDDGTYGAYSPYPLVAGQWTCVTGVRRGSTVELWVGNTMVDEVSIGTNIGVAAGSSGAPAAIGASLAGTTSYDLWDGYLDNVRLYDYALSPIEIQDL